MPKKAARRTVIPLDALVERPAAELVVVGPPPVVVPLPLVPVAPLDEGAVPVGRPKPENEPVRGPGAAEAEAPSPTRKPTLCGGRPENFIAAALKLSKVFPVAGALMEPTMPIEQWGPGKVCLQKNQRGFESSVIVRFHVGNESVAGVPVGIKMLPESKPSESGSQGLAKDVWVTEWLPGTPAKVNVTTVPFVAVMFGGLKMKTLVPVPPTVTLTTVCAAAAPMRASEARVVAKNILNEEKAWLWEG